MATIVMQSAKVIEACNRTIELIKCERTKRDEDAISRMMRCKRMGAWFKTYYPTREQALILLDTSDFWGWRSSYAWGDGQHAKKLLRLAMQGDPVTLNEEDVRVIF